MCYVLYESCDYVVSDDVDITHLVIALRRRLVSWKTYARDVLISKFSISKSKRGLHQYFNAPCHWQICLRRITSTASSKVLNAYLPLHAHLSPYRASRVIHLPADQTKPCNANTNRSQIFHDLPLRSDQIPSIYPTPFCPLLSSFTPHLFLIPQHDVAHLSASSRKVGQKQSEL
mgnify:CR=1 FL=1